MQTGRRAGLFCVRQSVQARHSETGTDKNMANNPKQHKTLSQLDIVALAKSARNEGRYKVERFARLVHGDFVASAFHRGVCVAVVHLIVARCLLVHNPAGPRRLQGALESGQAELGI